MDVFEQYHQQQRTVACFIHREAAGQQPHPDPAGPHRRLRVLVRSGAAGDARGDVAVERHLSLEDDQGPDTVLRESRGGFHDLVDEAQRYQPGQAPAAFVQKLDQAADAIQRDLDGSIQMELIDGAWEGTDVWYELRKARSLVKGEAAPQPPANPRTQFSSMKANGKVTDGVMQNDDFFDTLHDADDITPIVTRHEQGAAFMAEVYGRLTGNPAGCLGTLGPGATNLVTGIANAFMDSVPMVVITGQVPSTLQGTDAFQEAPVNSCLGPVAKHTFLVTDPEKLEMTVRTAFEIARTGRPGPVVIDLPKDVQNWKGTFRGEGLLPVPGYRQRLHAARHNVLSDAKCAKFFGMLAASSRPLIYAGGGVINGDATDELRRMAEHFGIPVTTTLMGIGAVDTTERLSLHMLGMHGLASANYAVEDCDFLIAVGARFDDRVAGGEEDLFQLGADHGHQGAKGIGVRFVQHFLVLGNSFGS